MRSRGFTLIELLVVIAIIGVLSSVVIGSLSTARNKARDAAVKEGVRQFGTMMALEYNDAQSYAALQSGWDYTAADCANSFSGTNATKVREICTDVVSNGGRIFTGNNSDTVGKFSIMGYLPSKARYFCLGSSGRTSDIDTGSYTSAGCYGNP